MLLLRRHFPRLRPVVLLFGAWLATCTGFGFYYAVSGLETLFYTLQLLLLIWFLVTKKAGRAALVCTTLLITRPEGMLFILPLALCVWPGWQRGRQESWAFCSACLSSAVEGKAQGSGGSILSSGSRPRPHHLVALALLRRPAAQYLLRQDQDPLGSLHYAMWHTQTFINYLYRASPGTSGF